jgi:hypothetical protein
MQSSQGKKVVETCYRYYVAELRSQNRFTPMCLLRLQDVTVDVIIVNTETLQCRTWLYVKLQV